MPSHPDELLEAFALDALENDEYLQVEQHLDSCPLCRGYVAQLHQTASGLGLFLDQAIPPAALGLRIRQALTGPVENAPVETGPSPRSTRVPPSRWFTTPPWAMPLAAVLMLSLFSLSLFMNIQAAGRMDRMERADSTVTAQLDQTVAQSKRLEEDNKVLAAQVAAGTASDASQMMDTIHEIRATSYLLAHPQTRPLVLEPPGGTGDSQGGIASRGQGE